MPSDLKHVLSFQTTDGNALGRRFAESLSAAAGFPGGGLVDVVNNQEHVQISPVVYVSQSVIFAAFFRALGLPEDNVEQDVDRLFKKYGSVMITEAMNDLEIVMMTLHERPREFNINLEGEIEAYAKEYFDGREVAEFKGGNALHVGVHPKFTRDRVFTTFKVFRETLALDLEPGADFIDAARAFLQSEITWISARPRTLGVFKSWSRRVFFMALDLGFPTGADIQAALLEMNPDFRGVRVLLTEAFYRGAFNVGNYDKMVTVKTACRGLYGALPRDVLAYIADFIPINQCHGPGGISKGAYERFDKILMSRHKLFLEVFFFFMWFHGGLPHPGDGEYWDLYAHMLEDPDRAYDWCWIPRHTVSPEWVSSQFGSGGPGPRRRFVTPEGEGIISVITETAPGVPHNLFLSSYTDKTPEDWNAAGFEFSPGTPAGPLVRGTADSVGLREITLTDKPGLSVSMVDPVNVLDFKTLCPSILAFTFFMEEFLAHRNQAGDDMGEHPVALRGAYQAYRKGDSHPCFNENLELTPVPRLSCSGCGNDVWPSDTLGHCGRCGLNLPTRVVDMMVGPDGEVLNKDPTTRFVDVELCVQLVMAFPWDLRFTTAPVSGFSFGSNSALVAPRDDQIDDHVALRLPSSMDLFRRIFADLNLDACDFLNGDRLFPQEEFHATENLLMVRADYGAPFQWVWTYPPGVSRKVVQQTQVIFPPDESDGPVDLSLLGWDASRLASGNCPAWFSNKFSPDRWRLNFFNLLHPVLSPTWCGFVDRLNQIPRVHGPGGTKLYDMKPEPDLIVEEAMRDLLVTYIPEGFLAFGVRDQLHVTHPGPQPFDVYNVNLAPRSVPGMWLRRMRRTCPELHTIMVHYKFRTTGRGINVFPVVPLVELMAGTDTHMIGEGLVVNSNDGERPLLHVYTTSQDVFTELQRVRHKSVARLTGGAPGETMDPFVDLKSVFRVLHYHGQPLHVYLGGKPSSALWRVDKDEAAKDKVRCTIPPRSLVVSSQAPPHSLVAVSMYANKAFSRYMKLVCS